MRLTITIEANINEVAVAYEHGLEIDEVADFVTESATSDLLIHMDNLGWLRHRERSNA